MSRSRSSTTSLTVYLCTGTDSERLEWFKTINIAGEELTDQELRNAVLPGSWVSDAKRYFSKNGCPAYAIGSDYMSGTPIRQDYLETVIKWINHGDSRAIWRGTSTRLKPTSCGTTSKRSSLG